MDLSSSEIIHHDIFHEHPLRRVPSPDAAVDGYRWANWCYGCWRDFLPGEAVYGCCNDICGFPWVLHQECAEMAREIRHPVHPSHPLKQVNSESAVVDEQNGCAVCEEPLHEFAYICSEGCNSWIHLGCAGGLHPDERESKVMKHPSHPQHELRLLKGKKRLCSFLCDACGTIDKGNSYICSTTICDYWIHESCANLHPTADFPRHHPNHSLSLAFHTPYEYIQYEYECAICGGALRLRHWVYHCNLCRYVVHIKCATNASPAAASSQITNENIAADDHKDIIKFPINDMYEEIIRPFVEKSSIGIFIPSDGDENIIGGKYKFHHHHHTLNFTTFSLSSSPDYKEEHDDDDDDDDDSDNISRVALTCDGCTLPIHQKQQKSSTSCSYDNGYMFCGECNYFLHLACFNLPSELSSLPLHPIKDHKLVLQKSNKLMGWAFCNVCYKNTNGLFYACAECNFKVDIKCASLPGTMKHAGHHPQPQHYLKLVVENAGRAPTVCGSCYAYVYINQRLYSCDSCKFKMCLECVFLPASNKHRLEKHRLPLTNNAQVNHPSDFYCGSCEQRMNPRMWMYHCRDCDESFHPRCFPTTSGRYRNINFGRHEYYLKNVTTIYHHPHHPLRFQLITKKKYCNLCRQLVYEHPGFQCAACNFVMCLDRCGREHQDDLKTID